MCEGICAEGPAAIKKNTKLDLPPLEKRRIRLATMGIIFNPSLRDRHSERSEVSGQKFEMTFLGAPAFFIRSSHVPAGRGAYVPAPLRHNRTGLAAYALGHRGYFSVTLFA
jgi:hypothetical protein